MKDQDQKTRRGFTLLYAALISALMLAVGLSIFNIAIKETMLSRLGRESQLAFYAADAGAECALYWDLKYTALPGYTSVFPTTTESLDDNPLFPPTSGVLCDGVDVAGIWTTENTTSISAKQSFTLNLGPSFNDPCAIVIVDKILVSGSLVTGIESRGRNICDENHPLLAERVILVTY